MKEKIKEIAKKWAFHLKESAISEESVIEEAITEALTEASKISSNGMLAVSPKERVVTIGHQQNCTCPHCGILDKLFGNVL